MFCSRISLPACGVRFPAMHWCHIWNAWGAAVRFGLWLPSSWIQSCFEECLLQDAHWSFWIYNTACTIPSLSAPPVKGFWGSELATCISCSFVTVIKWTMEQEVGWIVTGWDGLFSWEILAGEPLGCSVGAPPPLQQQRALVEPLHPRSDWQHWFKPKHPASLLNDRPEHIT